MENKLNRNIKNFHILLALNVLAAKRIDTKILKENIMKLNILYILSPWGFTYMHFINKKFF
jgi:hypothetical protein